MPDILEIMQRRHSSRSSFDAKRRVPERDLDRILEAARWAPTAHNMQNFEIVIVDDPSTLAAIGAIRSRPSETFLRENYRQLSFSEEELLQKKTGLLAAMFPASWRTPDAKPEEAVDAQHAVLGTSLQNCPMLLIIVYDRRKRAPASEGDVLGFMSLGCVMQSMWLMAEALGLGMQILSALGAEEAEDQVRRILALPSHMRIGFACRLGYPDSPPSRYLRVRREVGTFAHRNPCAARRDD